MSDADTFTCVALCKVCGAELDRAMGVPAEHRGQVTIAAPVAARCANESHNDALRVSEELAFNKNVVLNWYRETRNGLEFLETVTPEAEVS